MSILFDALMREKARENTHGKPQQAEADLLVQPSPLNTVNLNVDLNKEKSQSPWRFPLLAGASGVALAMLLLSVQFKDQLFTQALKINEQVNQQANHQPTATTVEASLEAPKGEQQAIQEIAPQAMQIVQQTELVQRVNLPQTVQLPQTINMPQAVESSQATGTTGIALIGEIEQAQSVSFEPSTVSDPNTVATTADGFLILGATPEPEQAQLLQASRQQSAPATMPTNNSNAALLAALQLALQEVDLETQTTHTPSPPVEVAEVENEFPSYGQLPLKIQQQVPAFEIVAHVYATHPHQRWLNVNGQELQQGDWIQGKMKIVEIRAQDIVMEVADQQFIVPAI